MDKSQSDNELSPCCVPPASFEKGASKSSKSAKLLQSQDLVDGVKPSRLISLPAGRGLVGTNKPLLAIDGESPLREVAIQAFEIDPFAVTNAWFEQFVTQTGYVTDAEQYGWSVVFHHNMETPDDLPRVANATWWVRVDGACWSHPSGAASTIDGLENHPVTHISWNDAQAFARWAGGRLPREQNGSMQPAPGRAMFAIRGETMSQRMIRRYFGVISGRATFQTPIPRRMAMPRRHLLMPMRPIHGASTIWLEMFGNGVPMDSRSIP